MTDAPGSRPATSADMPEIIELLQRSMGRADDPRFETLFRWKHLENVFGSSPMWVATDSDRVVGIRAFMRWEFERDGETVRCVRAVDTATHPGYQGRGIFRRLTLDALPILAGDGVQFVFNTPNAQSLPGYLKMGWRTIGRAEACVRPLSVRGGARLARSRVPASHWSEPATFGDPVDEVLVDPGFGALVAGRAPSPGRLRTRADPAFFAWRYGTPLLDYRAIVARKGIRDGVAFVRLRRRGKATEAVLASLLVPANSPAAAKALVREVARTVRTRADYVLGVGSLPGGVRLRGFGPVMTTREVAAPAPTTAAAFDLSLGDIELF